MRFYAMCLSKGFQAFIQQEIVFGLLPIWRFGEWLAISLGNVEEYTILKPRKASLFSSVSSASCFTQSGARIGMPSFASLDKRL